VLSVPAIFLLLAL